MIALWWCLRLEQLFICDRVQIFFRPQKGVERELYDCETQLITVTTIFYWGKALIAPKVAVYISLSWKNNVYCYLIIICIKCNLIGVRARARDKLIFKLCCPLQIGFGAITLIALHVNGVYSGVGRFFESIRGITGGVREFSQCH